MWGNHTKPEFLLENLTLWVPHIGGLYRPYKEPAGGHVFDAPTGGLLLARGQAPFEPPYGFAMKIDPTDPPKYTCWLPAVRLTEHQLERIRELYGPDHLSDAIRRRLLGKRAVGRPRRMIHQADPELIQALAEISASLQMIKRFHQELTVELELDMASVISLTLLSELHDKLNQLLNYYEKQD